jgi:ubiquinone/menaquinone biosynthesis C-methylase UbiE
MSPAEANPQWGSTYRRMASEKWKVKSGMMGRDATDALVDHAAPKPGMQVLDLASGTGEPAITIATRIAPGGHVTATDLSPEMLEVVVERANERGLKNISTQHADANKLPFGDNSFDLVTSRFGVMFFREDALRETRRVLKPGARACFMAWGPFEQPFWLSMMGTVHKFAGGEVVPPAQDPNRFGKPGSLTEFFKKGGFEKVQEETKTVPWTWHGTAEEVWELTQEVSAPFIPMIKRVPEGKWDEADRAVLEAVNRYKDGDQIKFGAVVVLASATKT